MKKLLYYFGQWLTVRYCIHENKKLLFEDWGERCSVYNCHICDRKVYEDL